MGMDWCKLILDKTLTQLVHRLWRQYVHPVQPRYSNATVVGTMFWLHDDVSTMTANYLDMSNPQSPDDGCWRCGCMATPQSQLLCCSAVYLCCCSAVSGEGRTAIGQPFRTKSSCLVSWTDTDALIRSCMSMAKCSITEDTPTLISSVARWSS